MKQEKQRLKVLFLCTGNSCRSQMAEGWARCLKSDEIEAYSAGIEAHGLNPRAVAVMKEAGIDISKQLSQTVQEVGEVVFDYIVTVCGHAHESCPVFIGTTEVVHAGFDDPAKATGSEEEIMPVFRRVRDEIRMFILQLPDWFNEQ